MKHFPFFLALMASSVFMSSCYQSLNEATVVNENSVTFSLKPMGVTQESMTRASFAAPEHLLVLDCMGERVKTYTQNSLADITMPLELGAHTLYFVASTYEWQSYDPAALTVTWGSGRISMTTVWAYKMDLTVTVNTTAEEVHLPLAGASIMLLTLDQFPENMGVFRVEGPDLCRGLNLKDMTGFVTDSPVDYSIDCNVYAGQTTMNHHIYTFVPASGKVGDVVLTSYDHSSPTTEIASRTLSEVPVTPGYVSKYTGYFFTEGLSIPLSYETDWLGVYNYNLGE